MLERTTRQRFKISLTPLIDMVFLLVIFFMLTTTFTRQEAIGLNYAPPSTQKDTAGNELSIVMVRVKQAGVLLLNDVPMDHTTFRKTLRRMVQQDPTAQVFIQPDYGATVQDTTTAIDQARLAEAKHLTIITPDPVTP